MNRKAAIPARILALLALILTLALCGSALADSYDANTMRLLRYQGDVEIYDPSGMPRFVLENVRFASGEAMQTGANGQASVGLDDSKIVTLDASSRVEFMQESGHIKLNLTEGTLFLDVQEKLDENESLDIQTTTMTVGIRGTIVFLTAGTNPAGAAVTTLGVLEGTAQIDYTDTSGAHRLLPVPAGQRVSVQDPSEGRAGVTPVISEMNSQDIEGFVIEQVLSSESLVQRVTDGSENGADLLAGTLTGGETDAEFDFPADGDWTWEDTVTLVAQSASKLYDGRPLSRPSDVLVYGLPNGLHIQVAANGSLTNAGSAENPIASYGIYNDAGENVTAHFPNIETVSGTLRVDPIPVTVWTGSAEKYYDGEPLTCDEAELKTAPGYVYGDPEWRNTSLVTRTALGSETMVSAVGITWVHGTNPLTGETQEIPLYAGQRLTVRLNDEGDQESITFDVENLKPEDLPEDILRLYADNPDLLTQACADTGWDPEVLAKLIAELPTATEHTVTRNGVKVSGTATEDLMQDSTNVRITIDTEITNYSNRALNGDEAHFTPIELEPTIKIIATGSQTEVGESENTYVIDWGTALAENYEIIGEELGTLTVKEVHQGRVTLSAASAEKVYDGKPLAANGYTLAGLPDGYTVTVTVQGSQTDAGEGVNRITEYQILDEDGEDASGAFPDFTVVNGKLTVTPAPLTVTTGSNEKVYDGEALTSDEAEISGLVAGETAAATATGSQTAVGDSENTYSIEWGTAKADNYEITEDLGSLTVEALALELNMGGMETTYNGNVSLSDPTLTYLSGSHAGETVSGVRLSRRSHLHLAGPAGSIPGRSAQMVFRFSLFTGDTVEMAISGFGTGVGTYTLTGDVSVPSGSLDDFDVSFTGTTMTVTPQALTITTPSASKPYDGTPLTGGDPTVTGLADGEEVTVTCTGMITAIGTAKNTYSIDWGDVDSANYTVTEEIGTLEILANDMPITVTAASASKAYDGKTLTDATYSIDGLPAGFTCEATVSGAQHDPGSTDNVLGNITIRDGKGNDVTAFFTNITAVNGTLTVTENTTPITVTAGDYSKVYDGEAIGGWVGVTVEGLPEGLEYMADCEFYADDVMTKALHPYFEVLDPDATGDPTSYFTNITYVDGTLTVSPAPLTITTASAEKVYDGTALTAGPATVTGLVSADDGKVTVTATGTITDAGTVDNSYSIDWGTVKSTNYTLTEKLGTLTVSPISVSVDILDTEYTFDNAYHFVDVSVTCDADYTAVFLGDSMYAVNLPGARLEMVFRVTAKSKDAGVTELSFVSYSLVYGNWDNFNLSMSGGTLTVHPAPITITTGSATKVYDGTPLTSDEVTVTGFPGSESITVSTTGTITKAGTAKNTYTIDNWNGWNPENYTITDALGTLTVEKLQLKFSVTDVTTTYTTKSIEVPFSNASLTFLNGTHAGETVTYNSRQRNISTSGAVYAQPFFYTLYTGDRICQYVSGMGQDVGTYTLTSELHGVSGQQSNLASLDVSANTAVWTVNPRTLSITTSSNSKSYDGTPLTSDTVTVSGLTDTDAAKVTVTATGTITDPGTASNTYSVDWGGVNASNYTINETLGTLEITTNDTAVTLTAVSASKSYDGTALTVSGVNAAGLPEGFTCTGTSSGSQTAVGSSDNVVTGYTILNAGGNDVTAHFANITTVPGTLTVTANDTAITVTSADAEGVYSPAGLANDDYTVEGLPTGFTLTAEVTGKQMVGGSSPNTIASYTITDAKGEDVTTFFSNVTLVEGTLTLAKDKIDIWSVNETFTYDGLWHSADVQFSGARNSENPLTQISATDVASVRNVGIWEATFTPGPIRSDLQDKYELGDVTFGTLTVEPVQLSFTASDKTADYDGTYVVPEVTLTYLNGSKEGQTVTPSSTVVGDGTAALTYSLFSTDTVTLTLNGLGKDAGTHTVTGTLTYDAAVTATNYTASAPTCTVTIRPITAVVSTGSSSKVYDGTALAGSGASITGLKSADEGKVTVTATGTITDAGSTDNTYNISWGTVSSANYTLTEELGTLTVTPLKVTFDLNAYNGEFPYPVVPEGITGTYEGGGAVEEVSETFTEGDFYPVAVTAVFNLPGGGKVQLYVEGADGAGSYTITPTPTMLAGTAGNYTFSYTNNTGTIAPLEMEFSLCREWEYYDGLFHGGDLMVFCDEEWFYGMPSQTGNTTWQFSCANGDTVNVTITGGGTEIGTYPLTCTYSFASGNPANYDIQIVNESIRIEAFDDAITLTADSASRQYDGTPLTAAGAGLTNGYLPYGWTWTAVTEGSQTDVGESGNTIKEYHIFNENGVDITSICTNVTLKPGTLTVTEKEVTFSISGTRVYNGQNQVGDVTVSGVEGATSYESSANNWTVEFADGAEFRLQVDGGGVDVGSHACYLSLTSVSGADNYKPTLADGTVTITKAPLTIATGSATKVYDGEPLVCEDSTVTGLKGTDAVTVTPGGFAIDVGKVDNEYDIVWTSGSASNYDITDALGTLEITPASITIHTLSETKVYDGNWLPSDTIAPTISGDVHDYIATESTVEWFCDAGERENSGKILWYEVNPENYDVTEDFGTLTIEPLQLSLDLGGKTVNSDTAYDLDNPTMTYVNGPRAGQSVPGTQTDPTSHGDVTFTLYTGDTIRVTVARPPEEPGTYTLSASISYSCAATNFTVSRKNSQFVILAADP